MHLTPREKDKLMIVVAADLARRRKDRGVLKLSGIRCSHYLRSNGGGKGRQECG